MDNKKIYKIFKIFFFACFLCFLTFYIAGESGYYEYNERKKMTLTKEQIKQFEEDVKQGKNVNINEYLENKNTNKQKKLSKTTLEISKNISKYTKEGITFVFNKIGKMVEE